MQTELGEDMKKVKTVYRLQNYLINLQINAHDLRKS